MKLFLFIIKEQRNRKMKYIFNILQNIELFIKRDKGLQRQSIYLKVFVQFFQINIFKKTATKIIGKVFE